MTNLKKYIPSVLSTIFTLTLAESAPCILIDRRYERDAKDIKSSSMKNLLGKVETLTMIIFELNVKTLW